MTRYHRFSTVFQVVAAWAFSFILVLPGYADDDPPPPPPAPSALSTVGSQVTNPATNQVVTVTELIKDPAGTPTAGNTAFVITSDGQAFLVKGVGGVVYNTDVPPVELEIIDVSGGSAVFRLKGQPDAPTASLPTQLPNTQLQAELLQSDTPGDPETLDQVIGSTGARVVRTGASGSNGRSGALFVPPRSGGHGSAGPQVSYTNSTHIGPTSRIGIEAGSVGGSGGKGGNSYGSFWSGRSGGNAGAGGMVTVTNDTDIQVATTGADNHGIFAYSRSGRAGDGGSGYAAPGGGAGGTSSNGGAVTVANRGNISTQGNGAYGIYALSVSNTGGSGGSQWGIVGWSGGGGAAGDGGTVTVANSATGSISTSGDLAHGILAQSIGGTGGSSGSSGNLLASIVNSPNLGGDGGSVSVTNEGDITTTGPRSRGIMAQSIGGGGGSGGTAGGLFAVGGSGASGGDASSVTVVNRSAGSIITSGSQSDGIFAQSIGGSGGSGSDAGGLLALGGTGSQAGHGGNVTVDNYGVIRTDGNWARGVVAQSIGGGGGDGGSSIGMVSVGGSGAGGGNSGTVTVRHGGIIETKGVDATGIFAQSVGGGGGSGGSATSVSAFAGVAVGGAGGGGGQGGAVNVTLQGRNADSPSYVVTHGDRSSGIFAQSVGGGGGSGGGAVQVTGGVGGAASVAVGGSGGSGGAGGAVTLSKGTGLTIVETGGNDAPGVLLQSVGGGGGSGGYAVSIAVASGPVSGSLGLAVGGSGGSGGAGGTVRVGTFSGKNLLETGLKTSILTTGERSAGMIAQSVGGGGGSGGLAVSAAGSSSLFAGGSVGVSLGGSGSSGGHGGAVSVGMEGDIITLGEQSTALLVQSVGGGGGSGGGSVAATGSGSGGVAGAISVALGGSGGKAGHGGNVIAATRSGVIGTEGDQSHAVMVQSVGGGGGSGGFSGNLSGAGAGAGAAAVSFGLGGTGGSGGDAGTVDADIQSDLIITGRRVEGPDGDEFYGHDSYGVLVQSVGGGGGSGGMNVSIAGAGAGAGSGAVSIGLGGSGAVGGVGNVVNAAVTSIIQTYGDRSAAFVAQSIGGGGGSGGFNISGAGSGAGVGSGSVTVGLGGSGGAGNHGGQVTASTSGDVYTFGDQSMGILAQSVGGGGGSGGFNISASGTGAGVGAGAVSVGLGGSGGAGGDGGRVDLTVNNNVYTEGEAATAVIAQSIGGGGGSGGFNVNVAGAGAGVGSGAVAVGLGGDGAGGGKGGVVVASVTGDIETHGPQSDGILVQSIGGGGGSGGFSINASGSGAGVGSGAVSLNIGSSGGDGGQASTATLTSIGDVLTVGDESRGVIVQSIGGGGGNAGLVIDASGSGAGVGSGAISVGIGGSGGSGGTSDAVTAYVEGDITTLGAHSDGFVAQSIGGGGGNAALTVVGAGSGAGVGSGAVSVGVGGSGGTGGDANLVEADYSGQLVTVGDHSIGFLAQAVGGGGGIGGGSIAAAGSGAGVGSGAVSVGIGGSGGAAGHGGLAAADIAVIANVLGSIDTFGAFSSGVVAQSIGGGGGSGGYSITANGSGAGTGSGAVGVGLGGSGAGGGDGKGVIATVEATVGTRGDQSTGVLVQSVGGGGGSGGFNVTAAGSGAGTGSGAVTVGLGGSGAGGGDAGAVTASTSGDVFTLGDMSAGILAQSVGGGGGSGGFNVTAAGSGAGTGSGAVGVGLGGSGGTGGDASTVTLTVDNHVYTEGENSGAVTAQSIGGGGGNGGFNVTVTGSGAGTGSGAVSVGLGGSGGGGGDAGNVTAIMTGDIATLGDHSTGLLAQSVGGGGGSGGFNVAAAGSGAGTGSATASIGLGGSGGDGGDAGGVISSFTGNVVTGGAYATGVTAQSIGGGGGSGGFNVSGAFSAAKTGSAGVSVGIGGSGGGGGLAGTVTNTVAGDVFTGGMGAGGVLAQSIGGGGGSGGFNVSGALSAAQSGSAGISVGIGGSGGSGGNAASVTNAVTGNVFTLGEDAFGILAQSIGGGGGSGGINVSGSISAAKSTAGAIAVGIGGVGGGGGDAASVVNTINGYVQTVGARAAAIATQSIGGGGGSGGMNVSGTITGAKTASGGLAVGVGGFGGDGGDGGDVTSTVTGGALTLGDSSAGIFTQSLGGGGGSGGMNISGAVNLSKENGGALGVGVGGFGGGGGDAGNVVSTVTTTEDAPWIITMGREAPGVMAQSVGGGGGAGGINVSAAVNLTGKSGAAIGVGVGGFGGAAGNAGNVTVNTTGDIETFGHDSNALVAQSIGGGGGSGGLNVSGALAITKPSGGDSSTTVAASIGVGGFGGDGGDAGDVLVNHKGTIVAVPRLLVSPAIIDEDTGAVIEPPEFSTVNANEGAHGLVAQSVGGGGGSGAVNVSGGVSYAAKDGDGHALLVGVGGFGGGGGNAGEVNVAAEGESITSSGNGRSAILASSIGGGGGSGGLNVSGGIVSDSPLIVGVGGFGGDGGTASNVTVAATTNLFTSAQADNAMIGAGLMAQSIGGGGGNGGLNVSGGVSIAKEDKVPSITFGIGGFGGAGAISGDVSATHTGHIETAGGWTHGVFAQSIAGGGGHGALNVSGQLNWADSENSGGATDLSIVAGIGGHGGEGANAGDVSVTSNGGHIVTSGDYSRGIFAQSVGGGGGSGGMNVTGVFAKNSSPVSLGVGGFGSGGGHAGSVTVNRGTEADPAAPILTDGIGAIGIEASSIGGGGGAAGMNLMMGVSLAGSGSGGGDGSPGGGSTPRSHPKHTGVDDSVFANFDKVLDELEGKAPTDNESPTDSNKGSAFAAQVAIGGAGGGAGDGGEARVTHYGDIETMQDHSHGILAQSIGGGGGSATLNIGLMYQDKGDNKNKGFNLAIGGAPGDAGDGAAVRVDHEGIISTHGNNSHGVLAQSIGGGGGNAGMDLATSLMSGGKIGITIGRIGGTGGSAGDVLLTSAGDIWTRGKTSYGLLAQSIGNGGGNSSSTSVALSVPADGDDPARTGSISVGLEGGEGGSAGNVRLEASGVVVTEGEDSHAIFAQSVGGGGGNAGNATGLAFKSSTAALAIGGTGGEGGTGGNVDVLNSALVLTNANRSVGILAQSVGGAGGTGGDVRAGGMQSSGSSALIAVGGSGGTGMSSGSVAVDNSGIIITDGDDSHGILAQSVGGGGGNAGMVINTLVNKSATDATQLGISVGGDGGDGATSGDVTVINSGGIGTSKVNSVGIFAQSVAGGGGNANKVVTGSVSTEGAGNKVTVGIGGSGGTGGAAGDVSVFNNEEGEIITLHHYSPAILAMSVGGGGGTGSTTISTNKSSGLSAGAKSMSLAFSLGGSGGSGGTGGDVYVDNAGTITTYGYKSHGIVAQSVGGGGGQGGMSISGDLSLGGTSSQNPDAKTSTVSIGGFGGDGNRAGDVTVVNSGHIVVHGDSAYGVYAQSVGGGGGDGGFAASLSRTSLANPQTDLMASLLNIAVGGFGGDGGDSGNVQVDHTGSITSHGDNSYGIFAQTVSGGGGNVGTAISSPVWTAADFAINALIGGRDGSAGEVGRVTVNTTGDIAMHGANSQAQFTQSVSGGGGNLDLFIDISRRAVELGDAGFELPLPHENRMMETIMGVVELGAEWAEGAVGTVIEATHVGDLVAWGEKSIASLIQSVGGGGGNADATIVLDEGADVDLHLLLGAKHTHDSSGGDVFMERQGGILTAASQSQGASVQSIGGGGGRLVADITTVSARNARTEGPSTSTANLTLGADPSFFNHGGGLDLNLAGDTITLGAFSPGLVLQSIGAGGGQAYLNGFESATINMGATDDSSGDGGDIRLSNVGAIMTSGRRSDGIVLQTIGGGGGYVITDLDAGRAKINTLSDNVGDGGDIDFVQTGDIIVTGSGSRGVVAQSLGGGGGIVDGVFAGTAGGVGDSGSINLQLGGNVLATGLGGTAIMAQSEASGRVGSITVSLTPGANVIGGVGGHGIALAGGSSNFILNQGLLATMGGIEGMAVVGTTGHDGISNSGRIVGSINLGDGYNTLHNTATGWLESGDRILLGWGALTNGGTIDPGGSTLQRTYVGGGFVQYGTPTWFFDIAEVGESDELVISGRANFGNSLTTINLHGPETAPTESGHYSLLTTAGGLADARFQLGTLVGPMPIGQTFALVTSDKALNLDLKPSTGSFHWGGEVNDFWNESFVDGVSNWTRGPDQDYIYGTPGVASDVIVAGDAVTALGTDFKVGSISGTGTVWLGGNMLITGLNGASTTWAGSFIGDGVLIKDGTGAFTLSGVNPMTGSTTVAGGGLFVDGWLQGTSLRVERGALLGGNGVVPDLTVAGGGVVAPGSSIGMLTVDGSATFQPDSIYQVETAGGGEADFLWVGGALQGSDALVHVQPGGEERYSPITMYGILRAHDNDAGVFTSVISDASYLDPSLQYGLNDLYLTLRRNDVDFRSAGTQGNSTAVAQSLNGLVRTATGEMAGVINTLYDLSDERALRAMGSMTGVLHQHVAVGSLTGSQAFGDVNMSRLGYGSSQGVVNLSSYSNAATGADMSTPRHGVWLGVVGGGMHFSGRDTDPGADVSSRGYVIGYDGAVNDTLTLGVSVAQTRSEMDSLDDRATSDMLHAGVYGRYTRGASRLAVLGGVSDIDNATRRFVTDGIGFSLARADYDSRNRFIRAEYGHTFQIGKTVSIEPHIGYQYSRLSVDDFMEQGASVLNLEAPDRRLTSRRSSVGGSLIKTFGRDDLATARMELRAAWIHEFEPIDSVWMRFSGDTADNEFKLVAPASFGDSAALGASFARRLSRHLTFVASVDGNVGGSVEMWTGSIGVRGTW